MGRIRTIKPEFFIHDELFELERDTGLPVRLAYAGLWTQSDREGRFKWKPLSLKAVILPWDDVDFADVLDALESRGFVASYSDGKKTYGHVIAWHEHQQINGREINSKLPDPDLFPTRSPRDNDASSTRHPRVAHASTETDDAIPTRHEGKGREGKGKEGNRECMSPEDSGDGQALEPFTIQEVGKQAAAIWTEHRDRHRLPWGGARCPQNVKHLQARMKEEGGPEPFLAALQARLDAMSMDPHYGHGQDWQPKFSWLLEPNGWTKAGELPTPNDRHRAASPSKPKPKRTPLEQELAELTGGAIFGDGNETGNANSDPWGSAIDCSGIPRMGATDQPGRPR